MYKNGSKLWCYGHKHKYFYISIPRCFCVLVSQLPVEFHFQSLSRFSVSFFSQSIFFPCFLLVTLPAVCHGATTHLPSFPFFFTADPIRCEVQFLKKRIIHWGFLHSLYPPKELAFLITLLHLITLHSPTPSCL